MLKGIADDLRFGARTLARSPGFTAVAVLSLALGVGANSAIFSLANAVLFRRLPVRDPDRLVTLWTGSARERYSQVSYPDYESFRARNDVFDGLVTYSAVEVNYVHGNQAESLGGEAVSGNFFRVLGVAPVLGRDFLPDEDRTPLTHPVAVISPRLWLRSFGGDPGVLGKTIRLNGRDFTVIGVAPRQFTGATLGLFSDFWVPMMMLDVVRPPSLGKTDPLHQRGFHWLSVIGRLKPGMPLAEAQARLQRAADALARAYPETNKGQTVSLLRASESALPPSMRGDVAAFARMLLAVTGLLLVNACANIAGLLLGRASARAREVSIRLSVGASRWRVVRQLLTESLLLSLAGGAVGLLAAMWTGDLLQLFAPAMPVRVALDTSPGARIFAFTLAVSVCAGILFGLAPALRLSRPDLMAALKQGGSAAGRGAGSGKLRSALVASQVAISLLLLICAGLLLRGLANAHRLDPGFDAAHLLVISSNLSRAGLDANQGKAFYEQARERLAKIPGVRGVTMARDVPLGMSMRAANLLPEGYQARPGEEMSVEWNAVGPAYFSAMGIPILLQRHGHPDPARARVPFPR